MIHWLAKASPLQMKARIIPRQNINIIHLYTSQASEVMGKEMSYAEKVSSLG